MHEFMFFPILNPINHIPSNAFEIVAFIERYGNRKESIVEKKDRKKKHKFSLGKEMSGKKSISFYVFYSSAYMKSKY